MSAAGTLVALVRTTLARRAKGENSMNRFSCVALVAGSLALSAVTAPMALEVTATKSGDQIQTDLNTDMKVSAFSAAVQAAFNALKARVDTFDARIATLEAWKPTVDAAIASLLSRVASLENTVNYLYGSWRPWAENYLSSLNNRLATVEARGTPRWYYGSCYQNAGWYGSDIGCQSGYVMQAVCSSGKNPDCSGNFTRVTCCQLILY
jgi:hypothetical protein